MGVERSTRPKKNYTITELECLGVVWSVRENVQFLGTNPFQIVTDHKALETLHKQKLPPGRRLRWILELDQYNYTIRHRQGRKMAHVDYFSRNPVNTMDEQTSRWEEVCFTFAGYNTTPCRTKWQNPRYHRSTTICSQSDHHSHWYCKDCGYCYNPVFWKPQPPEDAKCDCNIVIASQPSSPCEDS